MHHLKVLQSPIVNDCLKVKIDDRNEPQLVPKLLLKVSNFFRRHTEYFFVHRDFLDSPTQVYSSVYEIPNNSKLD